MKHKVLFLTVGILTALLTLISGCTSGTAKLDQTSALTGRLIVNITDAPSAPEIDEVWLTITGLQVHMAGSDDSEEQEQEQEQNSQETQNQENNQNQNENGGGWIEVSLVGDARFNLLTLQNGLQAKLAMGELDAGKYTQLRMDVKLVELHIKGTATNVYKEAKLPSNVLKFVHPFEIVNGEDTVLLFDFDALKSVNETGNGKYMFKPVIKLTTTKQPQGNLEITTTSLPNGQVNVDYTSTTLTAIGGKKPYTWSLDTGSTLPAGLTLTAEGVLAGKPTTVGGYTFTIKVVDDNSQSPKTATKTFSIVIAAATP